MKKFCNENFKISFDSEATRIYENGGVVVVTLNGFVNVPTFHSEADGWNGELPVAMGSFWVQSKGIARVMIDDVYDYETGVKIATAKAESKAYEIAKNKIAHRVEELQAFTNAAFSFFDKSKSVVEHNADYIKRIGK